MPSLPFWFLFVSFWCDLCISDKERRWGILLRVIFNFEPIIGLIFWQISKTQMLIIFSDLQIFTFHKLVHPQYLYFFQLFLFLLLLDHFQIDFLGLAKDTFYLVVVLGCNSTFTWMIDFIFQKASYHWSEGTRDIFNVFLSVFQAKQGHIEISEPLINLKILFLIVTTLFGILYRPISIRSAFIFEVWKRDRSLKLYFHSKQNIFNFQVIQIKNLPKTHLAATCLLINTSSFSQYHYKQGKQCFLNCPFVYEVSRIGSKKYQNSIRHK